MPKNIIRRKQWLEAIGKKIKNFSYIKNSVICSQHFTKDSFIVTGCGKLYLKTNTVPTVFNTYTYPYSNLNYNLNMATCARDGDS